MIDGDSIYGETHVNTQVTDPKWNDVKQDDLFKQYKPMSLEDFERGKAITTTKPNKKTEYKVEKKQPDVDRFVQGTSKFVQFKVKIQFSEDPEAKQIKEKAVNSNVTVGRQTREKFSASLQTNITEMSKMLLMDILPLTLAINTAVLNTDERLKLLTGLSANLPKGYIEKKAVLAVQLRINRKIAEMFNLSMEEVSILNLEQRNEAAPKREVVYFPMGDNGNKQNPRTE